MEFWNAIPTGLPGGFFVYDAEIGHRMYYADDNVVRLYGCATQEEFREHIGNSFDGMVHPEDFAKIQNDISAQTFADGRRHDYVRYRIVTKQGTVRYVEDFGHLVQTPEGRRFFYVFIVDVGMEEYLNREANSAAESEVRSSMRDTDALTGLMNRESFYADVQVSLLDSPHRPDTLTFAHFDLLNFKVFNEEFGFQAGDDLLCLLAHMLHREFADGLVARFSNDHFTVCAQIDADEMINRATHIHTVMEGAHDAVAVEVKAGIYEMEDSCSSVKTACDHARLACSTVKHRYDRVYGVYDANLYESLRLQQHVVGTVDAAIANGYIKVYYQPIVRVSTGKICGYEALTRWDDPTMGFLPPSRFIETLEEYHLIHKVDCFVLRRVYEDLAMLQRMGEPIVPVSVNLSRFDFELQDMFRVAEDERLRNGVAPGLIDIEITESTFNENSLYLLDAIKRFRKSGYRVWVDDFGSGYSALNSLLDYEFDVLKLDLEFLRTYDEQPRAATLIDNVIHMAHGIKANALQEGVETEEHFKFLRGAGCEMAQGYYFARPMPLLESRALTRSKGLEWETL